MFNEKGRYGSNWKQLREIVLKRDGYRCRLCGRPAKRLHVHHIRSLWKGGTNDPSNLITLCEDCHAKFHKHLRPLINYFREVKKWQLRKKLKRLRKREENFLQKLERKFLRP